MLDRTAARWRGITYTFSDVRLLQLIRRGLDLTVTGKERSDRDPKAETTQR
jgi:hypothetical protein